MGAVSIGTGACFVDFSQPDNLINQSHVTFFSLAQSAGQRGTVRFVNIDGNISSLQHLFITNAPTLTNHLIGGWATFEREFATYSTGQAVGGLTNNGYAGYSPNTINAGGATDNIRVVL